MSGSCASLIKRSIGLALEPEKANLIVGDVHDPKSHTTEKISASSDEDVKGLRVRGLDDERWADGVCQTLDRLILLTLFSLGFLVLGPMTITAFDGRNFDYRGFGRHF